MHDIIQLTHEKNQLVSRQVRFFFPSGSMHFDSSAIEVIDD